MIISQLMRNEERWLILFRHLYSQLAFFLKNIPKRFGDVSEVFLVTCTQERFSGKMPRGTIQPLKCFPKSRLG